MAVVALKEGVEGSSHRFVTAVGGRQERIVGNECESQSSKQRDTYLNLRQILICEFCPWHGG